MKNVCVHVVRGWLCALGKQERNGPVHAGNLERSLPSLQASWFHVCEVSVKCN